jgi:Zn-dependent protease with chaperone function
MRSYLASVGLNALTRALWGETATTGVAIDAQSLQLLELGYSRELEQAADDGAFDILRRAHLDPTLLGDALERITTPLATTRDLEGEAERGEASPDGDGDAESEAEGGSGGGGDAEREGEGGSGADAEGEGGAHAERKRGAESEPIQRKARPFNWVELEAREAQTEVPPPTEAEHEGDASPVPASKIPPASETSTNDSTDEDEPLGRWRDRERWSFLSTHPVTKQRIAHAREQRE